MSAISTLGLVHNHCQIYQRYIWWRCSTESHNVLYTVKSAAVLAPLLGKYTEQFQRISSHLSFSVLAMFFLLSFLVKPFKNFLGFTLWEVCKIIVMGCYINKPVIFKTFKLKTHSHKRQWKELRKTHYYSQIMIIK